MFLFVFELSTDCVSPSIHDEAVNGVSISGLTLMVEAWEAAIGEDVVLHCREDEASGQSANLEGP